MGSFQKALLKKLTMNNYILYILVFFILIFVIYMAFKAVRSNIALRRDLKSDDFVKSSPNSDNDILAKVKEANEMKKKGIITEEEFDNIKKKFLDN